MIDLIKPTDVLEFIKKEIFRSAMPETSSVYANSPKLSASGPPARRKASP
ncbi:MAG: hypothetical protein PHW87_10330 [Methanothrix sp.]|nr:hypothetical protein [Methanothrix sp.]